MKALQALEMQHRQGNPSTERALHLMSEARRNERNNVEGHPPRDSNIDTRFPMFMPRISAEIRVTDPRLIEYSHLQRHAFQPTNPVVMDPTRAVVPNAHGHYPFNLLASPSQSIHAASHYLSAFYPHIAASQMSMDLSALRSTELRPFEILSRSSLGSAPAPISNKDDNNSTDEESNRESPRSRSPISTRVRSISPQNTERSTVNRDRSRSPNKTKSVWRPY